MKVRVNIMVDDKLWKALRKYAIDNGVSASSLVESMIKQFLQLRGVLEEEGD